MTVKTAWKPTQAQEAHLENLFVQLEVPAPGRAFIRNAIANAPSRPVSNRRGNVTFKFMSRKNDRVLELESRSGEYPQAVLLESDVDVVMYLCQAPKETLSIVDEHGKRTGTTGYHLDFLVVYSNKIVGIEVRDEAALYKQHLDSPHQFWFDTTADQWHFRAAETHFGAMGIDFQITATRQIDSTHVNNLKFLEDFLVEGAEPADPEVMRRLQRRVSEAKRLSFMDALSDGFTADQMYFAIAHGEVYVDLQNDQVGHAQTLAMYASREVREVFRMRELEELTPIQPIPGSMFLRTGARIEYGGRAYYVVLCGERDVQARDSDGKFVSLNLDLLKDLHSKDMLKVDGLMADQGPRDLAHCSDKDLAGALRRLNALRNNDTSEFSKRSLSRFAGLVRGITGELAQLLALVDDNARRGNREPRYSERDEEMIQKAVEQKYSQPEACTKTSAYGYYMDLCDAEEQAHADKPTLNRVSFTTFSRRVDSLKDSRQRLGKRKAYQQAGIFSPAHDPYPVHGALPHEVCYIDHTNLNLATVSGDGSGTPLAKPWITVGLDGCTSQARALIMTYAPPSATTVMLLMRDYVRRNQRLPKILALDNGKEFKGKVLESFCRLYGIHIRYRPPGQPRGGAPIESLLGAIESEVISEMTGNTIALKDPRLVTKSVNGFNHAEHTLMSAYKWIEDYLFRVRESRTHSVLGVSP